MRRRPTIQRPAGSREFTDQLLAELAAARWSPRAWSRFFSRSFQRSWQQSRLHPRALSELTAIHAAFALLCRPAPPTWPAASWLLSATHLGLLGPGDRWLGWPNRLSLLRANLPAIANARARWPALAALGTDLLDGWLARRGRREEGFGGYVDGIADVAFWSWLVWRREPNPWLRAISLAGWVTPAVGVTIAVFATGRTLDHPRFVAARRASAGLQCLAAFRSLRRPA